ncbi:MAG TPA: tannase/feruloyl esterase family alpha/beta hydrolase [Terracidiphilus sp.]|nr:tannase/feruloyl esterase family alpha/beta hydrolase [Terracidiphilus sp.]
MRTLAFGLCLGVLGTAGAWGQAGSCGQIAKVNLEHTTIVSAEEVAAGKLTPPDTGKPDAVYSKVPAFCRVVAESHPSSDSQIKIEVWLPLHGWNGKFLGQGNGGFAGYIDYIGLSHAVRAGYASAGTDTGHTTQDALWALGHPEKMVDYGYRGIHEMTETGEAVTQAFYGKAPDHRYFSSCSNGGREALMEAQRFPEDYDGIVAGAPAYNWTHLVSGGLAVSHKLFGDPASYIPASKVHAIATSVLAQCDKTHQGFLDDPRTCQFDPGVLLCKGAENDACLTAPQVTALKGLYAGAQGADGKQIEPGYLPGAEEGPNGWGSWVFGESADKSVGAGFVDGYFKNMVYEKADLDVKALNLDEALNAATEKTSQELDAVNPDLGPFRAHGGKLILYHGWNDPAIPAVGTVDYYNEVVEKAGAEEANGFVRLFVVPGLQHCGGGPGLNSFGQGWSGIDGKGADADHSIVMAVEKWVETGTAPERVTGAHVEEKNDKYKVTMTRPLCAYPKVAKYKGKGKRSEAGSWECGDGPRDEGRGT